MAYLGGHVGNCLGLADGPNQAGDVDDVASASAGGGGQGMETDKISHLHSRRGTETIVPLFLRHSDGRFVVCQSSWRGVVSFLVFPSSLSFSLLLTPLSFRCCSMSSPHQARET